MNKIMLICVGFLTCLANGLVFSQTTEPTTKPDYQTQEAVLANKILADNRRLVAAAAARQRHKKISMRITRNPVMFWLMTFPKQMRTLPPTESVSFCRFAAFAGYFALTFST